MGNPRWPVHHCQTRSPLRAGSANQPTESVPARWAPASSLLIAGVLLLTPAPSVFGADDGVVAVYSAVSPAYTRTALPDGSFKSETYAFGEGGSWGGSLNDFTIDKLRFVDIARLIAPTLAGKNYLTSKDPHQTDLLIMVYWGTTSGTNDNGGAASSALYQTARTLIPPPLPPKPTPPAGGRGGAPVDTAARQAYGILVESSWSALAQADMLMHISNRQRDLQNWENAKVLGYLPEMSRVADYKGTALAFRRQDVVEDVEENRYFVVLLAYDFQELWLHKQRKLLWETRFSIREQGHDFGQDLAAIAQYASRYFGQDSNGLIRKPLRETKVILGEPKVLGYESETKK
jgi:hypothetical protein